MPNSYFQFKQFRIDQDQCAMKVTTDACILGAWTPLPRHGCVLDIGTGTGLLALMIAQRADVLVDAVEFDEPGFLQAKKNIISSKWKDRIHIFQADIRLWLPEKKYELIICNPPFYEGQYKPPDYQKKVAWHDEMLNLADLLKSVHRLLMFPEAKFSVLLPANKTQDFTSAAATYKLYPQQQLQFGDKFGNLHRTILVFATTAKNKVQTEVLTIKNNAGIHSNEFVQLMKQYYLYL